RRDPERQTARVDGNAISLGARPTGHNASKTVAAKLSQRPPSARPVAQPSEQLRSESLPRRQPKPPAAKLATGGPHTNALRHPRVNWRYGFFARGGAKAP